MEKYADAGGEIAVALEWLVVEQKEWWLSVG
jgi:hypothetical protein